MIAFILGTRPEIIKMSPLIRAAIETKQPYYILHTNQHYSESMDKVFFKDLDLPQPKYNLGIGSGQHGQQTGAMLAQIEEILLKDRPDVVLVQGDTNTVLAGALAASKLGIPVGHIEAGLRSYDRTMPEEINRIATDHISDLLFPPTQMAADILAKEGIDQDKIHVTGNTVVDAVYQNQVIAQKKSKILEDHNLKPKDYFLLTMHRPSNVDNKETLSSIMRSLEKIGEKYNKSIVFPIHPRTQKQIEIFKLSLPKCIHVIEPAGYLDFLVLQKQAYLILTDSGGVQEEACTLGVPSVTLRENTERPETIQVGASILAGSDEKRICEAVEKMLEKTEMTWENPFGDGEAAKRTIALL